MPKKKDVIIDDKLIFSVLNAIDAGQFYEAKKLFYKNEFELVKPEVLSSIRSSSRIINVKDDEVQDAESKFNNKKGIDSLGSILDAIICSSNPDDAKIELGATILFSPKVKCFDIDNLVKSKRVLGDTFYPLFAEYLIDRVDNHDIYLYNVRNGYSQDSQSDELYADRETSQYIRKATEGFYSDGNNNVMTLA